MKKERKVIKNNAIIFFNRNVNSSELSKLPKGFEGDIIINGILEFDEENIIECNRLFAKIVVSNGPKVYIKGDLYTEEDICVEQIKVNGSVYCQNNCYAAEIIVAENCIIDGELGDSFTLCNIAIGGDFTCKTVKYVNEINVLGKFKAKLKVDFVEVDFSIGS